MYYQEHGDENGPLMVFLHGGGVSSWMWDKQIQYFTDYHCVTVDLPEHGKSKSKEKFSIESSAYKVNKLIEKLSNEKSITVIGFSLGAQVLVQMLSMKPNLIDYAMINSALVRPSTFGVKVVSPLVKLTFPLIKNRIFSRLQAKSLYIGNDKFEKYYSESSQMESKTLICILKENMSFNIPSSFSEASGKILITVGEREKKIMKKSAMDLVSGNANCKGVTISEIGHGVPLANPKLFKEMIESWIKDEKLPKECNELK